jgi:hypothetical protein
VLGFVGGVACIAAPAAALADVTKDQCIDANASAQSLRREGRFADARKQLAICMDPRCPKMITGDCGARLEELERAQPTIVLDAKDARGADVSAVKVTMDGQLLAEKLDGRALPVDPKEHTFTFEAAGQAPVTRTFVAREGDRGRRVSIVLGEAAPPAAPSAQPEAASPAAADVTPQGSSGGTQKTLGIVAGAAGLAALAGGTVFGLLASSAKDAYQKNCGSNIGAPSANLCTSQGVQDNHDASSKALVSTVLFIGGGVALAGGLVLFVTAPSGKPGVEAAVVPNGLLLRGAF